MTEPPEPPERGGNRRGGKESDAEFFVSTTGKQAKSRNRRMPYAKLAVKSLQYVITPPKTSYGTSSRTDYHY
jgi:hypothetical protein